MILQIILWAALFASLALSIRASIHKDGLEAVIWLFALVMIAMVIGEHGCGPAGCA